MSDFYLPYMAVGGGAELDVDEHAETVWPGFPVADEARDYVPRDARLRAATYAATAGQFAQYFPIDLTPCT